MAGEEVAKRNSERRTRSRAGSNLKVNFNGGGVVLLLGAAAGALLASAFAAHRVRAHKRRRGSMTDGIQGDSGEHLDSHETKEFVGDEGKERDGANAGDGMVQVNSHESLDASVQMDFYLLEEGKGEVAERSPTTDIELVDGDHRKPAGCRDFLNAYLSSSPPNAYRNLGIGNSLGENQIRCDDEELVAASIKEEHKISFLNYKENDEEDNKKAYLVEWGEREEVEENLTSLNQFSEQPRLTEISGIRLDPLETLEFVEDIKEVEGGANTMERRVEVNTYDDLHANLEILDFVKRKSDIYLVEKMPEISLTKEIEVVDGVEGELTCLIGSLAKIGSSPTNFFKTLGVDSTSKEDQLKYENEQVVVDSVRENGAAPYKNCKKEWIEREKLEEKVTRNLNTEELYLVKNKSSQNLEMFIAVEERKLEDGFKDEMYNSIVEFALSRAKEMATSSSFGDQYEINPLIEEIEPFFYGSGEAKKAMNMTQIDSGKHLQMLIIEEEIRVESGGFKDAALCVEQDNKNGDASENKMVEGSKSLCEQTIALPHESSFTAISELEKSSPEDSIMVMAEGDFQLIAYTNGIIYIEEDKMDVEESNCPSNNEGIESCIRDNPAMITAVEEKTQVEDNVTCDHYDVTQEEKAEDNLLDEFIENAESSETEDILREIESCPLTESRRIEFSLEQDNLMAQKESPLIQFQRVGPVVREEKGCLEDWFPLSLESNMKLVQPIQDDNLCNSEKSLGREECHLEAGAEELGTSLNEVEEREHETSSAQFHEVETRQYSEAHKDKLEWETEYPQTLPGVGEIHKELQAQITSEDEEQILMVSVDLVEKGVNMVAKTTKQDTKTQFIDLGRKHQCQVESNENNFSSKGKQQRIPAKKVHGIEYMFMGYPKGHIFLVMTLAIAFAVLAFLYTKILSLESPSWKI